MATHLTDFDVPAVDAIVRLAVAFALGLLIGLERFYRRKPIDFRPFVIIALAACALTMGGVALGQQASDPQLKVDPTRVFAGVITGIGFLGAGAMFREGDYVQGAGSAAAIWAVGAVGILAGAGLLKLAAGLGIAVLLVLLISRPFVRDYDAEHDGGS